MEQVLVKNEGKVSRLILNRPDRRNALSLDLMEDLIKAFESVPVDAQAVVVSGEGPAFSAGHDLSEMIDRDPQFYDQLFDACTRLMETIGQLPQPVIARVHGVATAAGCQLVAACDLVVAAENARFATPGVKIGLFCSTPMVPVSRAIGRKRAMELLLTGEPIGARTAQDWGLVNRVVPEEQLDEAVDTLIDQITRFSPSVIALGKSAFYTQIDLEEHEAYEHTKRIMTENAQMADAQEGMSAFLEKRAPKWSA